jgi:hypothetical protein
VLSPSQTIDRFWLIAGTEPALAWRNWEKARKELSVPWFKIRSGPHPNTNLKFSSWNQSSAVVVNRISASCYAFNGLTENKSNINERSTNNHKLKGLRTCRQLPDRCFSIWNGDLTHARNYGYACLLEARSSNCDFISQNYCY